MRELADFVIVDCSSDRTDLLSSMARNEADVVLQIISPNLKTMCYYASNPDLLESVSNSTVQIINVLDKDIYLPLQEVSRHFKGIPYTLPYCRSIKQQSITGTLSHMVTDRAYRKVAKDIAKAVM